MKFGPEYPHQITQGSLIFTGPGMGKEKPRYPVSSLLEFDAAKRETAFMAKDYWLGERIEATEAAARSVAPA